MGISLEGRSIAWSRLHDIIASRAFGRAFEAAFLPLWEPDPEAERAWAEGTAELTRYLDDPAEDYYPELSREAQVAFVAIVQHAGRLCGTLTQNSLAGSRFRKGFLGRLCPQVFGEPALAEWLIDRPFFGLSGLDFPAWGGLQMAEIRELLRAYREPQELDPELLGWLRDLRDLLANAEREDTDLVILYF